MRARTTIISAALIVGLVAAFAPAPAAAGVDWFGIGVSSGGFSFSLGYSDYPEYSNAWNDPYWNMSYDRMLDGYGQWVYVAGLGRVWQPYVASEWRPYTYGRWAWTSMGWTWVAYEPWGYVPFHYGEWAFTTFGWVWVPGYSYRPANVVWFSSGGMVGWMPCAPRGWSNAHRGFWRGYDRGYRNGYVDGWRDARYATWVDWRHMGADNVASYAYSTRTAERQVSAGNLRTVPTLDRREVEQRGGIRVPEATISRRQVRVGERTVDAVRVNGLDRDVERHARATVTRGLAPQVSRKLERREPVTRSVAPSASRSLTPERSRTSTSGVSTRSSGPVARPRRTEPSRVESRAPSGTLGSSRREPVRISTSSQASRAPVRGAQAPSRSPVQVERSPQRYEPQRSSASRSPAPVTRAPQPVQRYESRPSIERPTTAPPAQRGSSRPSVTSRETSRSLEIRPPSSRSPRATTSSRSTAQPSSTATRPQSRTDAHGRVSAERSSSRHEPRQPERKRR